MHDATRPLGSWDALIVESVRARGAARVWEVAEDVGLPVAGVAARLRSLAAARLVSVAPGHDGVMAWRLVEGVGDRP